MPDLTLSNLQCLIDDPGDPELSRRLRKVCITHELMLHIFGAGLLEPLRDVAQLPPDARIVGVGYTFSTMTFDFLVQHASFSPVEVGTLVPRFDPDCDLSPTIVRADHA